ncbi:hypothetical protein ACVR0S_09485 [Streptococcus dentapri]|uniref:Uncharacterized protein n=1 Tax=Streptococcus dentapri TaxID=573564 RepID=A0ABV8D2E3_9STRE
MTKPLTKAGLYALMLMNDNSNDIPFLPLEAEAGESRKELLTRTLEQGYEDLKEAGYLNGADPTEAFVTLGYCLSEYSRVTYHIQIDDDLFCAPQVDAPKRMCVLISKTSEDTYHVEYVPTIIVLALLIGRHEALQGIDGYMKNYLRSHWSIYAYMRFFTYYGDKPALRLQTEQLGYIIQDHILVKSDQSGLLAYDVMGERLRSLSSEEFKAELVQQLKVVL